MSEFTQLPGPLPEPTGPVLAVPAGTRVDAAHILLTEPVAAQAVPARAAVTQEAPATASQEALALVGRLKSQGRQLARLLQDRQRDLDHREAQQNALAAELAAQSRAAQLWLTTQHEELAAERRDIAAQAQRIAAAQSELSAAEAYQDAARRQVATDIERREAAHVAAEQELERRERRLALQGAAHQIAQREFQERRQREHAALVQHRQQTDRLRGEAQQTIRLSLAGLERRRAALEEVATQVARRQAELTKIANRPSAAQTQYARELDDIAERMLTRQSQLAAAEEAQGRAAAELATLKVDLAEERQRLVEQARADRRHFAQRERAAVHEAEQLREQLRLRGDQLDAQQHSLGELRDEAVQAHRAALELRIAAEEALSRLAGSAAPASVAQTLAEARQRLSDQWSLMAARLSEERAALVAMAADIAEQSRKLGAQKDSLSSWMADRQREFDQQAAALAAREEELRDAETHLRTQRNDWESARFAFEQQLRQTSSQWLHADG